MRQSQLFTKTSKSSPAEEQSINAKLLLRGGFIYKNSAGIYSYLPLGWQVIKKISNIIREEMDAIGGQEMFMPALHDKHYLQTTGRWDVDVVFKIAEEKGKEPQFNISWTHEEILTEIASKFVSSYRDLPFAAYQIQTKFRNEPRAKSGLLRGREFMMKDLYSFHVSEEDLWQYYEKVKQAYHKIFKRCGLKAFYTLAAGGDFTASNTHEFQVLTSVGEDTVFVCEKCEYAENKEISNLKDGDTCPRCGGKIGEHKGIEVGNIFPLGTKYSEAFGLNFTDVEGKNQKVVMGSYGIGVGRVMGTAVELFHDEKGILWPESIAPFTVHLLAFPGGEVQAETAYEKLQKAGCTVLYDDRDDKSAGEKLADADLIGIPWRIVVSRKTVAQKVVEVKKRDEENVEMMDIKILIKRLKL